jgi:hypothetical protein
MNVFSGMAKIPNTRKARASRRTVGISRRRRMISKNRSSTSLSGMATAAPPTTSR